jgi:hypothetical protein
VLYLSLIMYAPKLGRFITAIGLTTLVLSCDVAGGLFSQSELADMYEVGIDLDGIPLSDGDLVRTDAKLVPVIESRSGFSSPGKLTLALVNEDGSEVASLGYVTASSSAVDVEGNGSLRAVSSIEGDLPPFTLPDDLVDGYYFLEARLYDDTGRVLSDTATLLLVYNGDTPAPQIEVFPSSPAMGQTVYLRLFSTLPETLDPWIRWHIGGTIGREGYASDHADRMVWRIPETDGFFSVRAELFPFKPPAEVVDRSVSTGKSYSSAFRSDLILAVGPAGQASPLAAIDLFHSLDFRSEPGTLVMESSGGTNLPVSAIGTPYLESHEHGYGHALLDGSGYLIPGSILPPAGTDFSFGITFDPVAASDASGYLVTLQGPEGDLSLMRIGVSGGLPYLEAGDSFVGAFSSLPAGLCRLVVEVVPSGGGAAGSIVSLFLNDELVGSGVVAGSLFEQAEQVTTLVGGPEGLAAVYDQLSVAVGRYPAFFVGKAHELGNQLIAASGFEGGSVGWGISVQGPSEAGDGFIRLFSGSILEIPVPSTGFIVEIDGYGAVPELILVMDDGSTVVLQDSDTALASWGMGQPVSLAVEAVEGGLRIRTAEGLYRNLTTLRSLGVLRIQSGSPVYSSMESVMVRTFSSMDSISRKASDMYIVRSDS